MLPFATQTMKVAVGSIPEVTERIVHALTDAAGLNAAAPVERLIVELIALFRLRSLLHADPLLPRHPLFSRPLHPSIILPPADLSSVPAERRIPA